MILDELVAVLVDLGGRDQGVAALGAEVQVMAGQAAAALIGAGEVGMNPARWGPHVGGGAIGQPGRADPEERGEAVPGWAR